MKTYYCETGLGACLVQAQNLNLARHKAIEDAGTHAGVQLVRKASSTDIEWVRAMGGWVPETGDEQ